MTGVAAVGAPSTARSGEDPPVPGGSRTARVLVVADDLTGANATAAGFARDGYRTVTIAPGQDWATIASLYPDVDSVVLTTESRHATPSSSAAAVSAAVRAGWPAGLVSKRIDTTLRGNVGVEAAAALRTVAELSGRRCVGLCLPAHPSAGRYTVEGSQLLDGRRLEDTELARDPRTPVRTSVVAEVLAAGTELAIAHVPLSTVVGDPCTLRTVLAAAVAGGADVVVADALADEHLARVAAGVAALTASEPDLAWVGIDPGPGSLALARALGLRGEVPQDRPLLAVSGSATELTGTQLRRVVTERSARVVQARHPLRDVGASVRAVVAAARCSGPGDVVVLTTALHDADRVDLAPNDAEVLAAALGRVTREVLDRTAVGGLFLTGGDVTASVLHHVGAHGVEVEDEVVPLAVAGALVGGPWAGLPVVTKGGLVGDSGTTLTCLDHLGAMARRRRRRVRANGL